MSWISPTMIISEFQLTQPQRVFFWLQFQNSGFNYYYVDSIKLLIEYLENDWEADFHRYVANYTRENNKNNTTLQLGGYKIGFANVNTLDQFEIALKAKIKSVEFQRICKEQGINE